MIQELVEIARKAGEKIMQVYENPQEVNYKTDESPLTLADTLANEVICTSLKRNWPEIPIISEENKNVEYDTRKSYAKFWLVDPLDGTKEFIKRNGEFTVNIALIENGMPVKGVVYCPAKNETYYAEKGKGAFAIINGQVQQLMANKFSESDEGLKMVCSRSHLNPETEAFISKFKNPEITNAGSSLKFMLIASGKADIYPRLAPTMEWDTAAAQIVLEEAGGTIFDDITKQPMRYNKEVLRNNPFVAFGKGQLQLQ
ncbi:MAG: 3'(2'),5'-bisphosphate nucleotidase [Sphingobacteriales bacterium]|nr:MAG: 3'(2'),5'-bisphosphate nucleotidase [Sphingobacteriales bacterium]